jgi:exopolyphosphatase/guanosine-5'-triphosphate,3'-diphosphate pyrophosphatase
MSGVGKVDGGAPTAVAEDSVGRGVAGLSASAGVKGEAGGAVRPEETYAAVDLGTNNCRLLIARPAGNGFRVVDSYSRIVRLGAGIAETGALSQAAMDRTIAALSICAQKMRRHKVTRQRHVATEACRRARNGHEFLRRVEAETGLHLDVIPAEEEARLALSGCTPLLDAEVQNTLVFDIGGGSTELIWTELRPGEEPRMLAWTSLPCGVVTLAEEHGGREPNEEQYEAMVSDVQDRLAEFEGKHQLRRHFEDFGARMVGISGTVTTLAAVLSDLPRYDRSMVDGAFVSTADLLRVSRELAAMSYAARVAHPCIRRGRADLVLPGCAALEAILRTWPSGGVRVADRGLREGILRALMGTQAVVAASPR